MLESPQRTSTSEGRRKRGSSLEVLAPIELEPLESQLQEFAHRVALAGGDDEVVGLLLLHHQPHRLDVVAGEAPIAAPVQVAEAQLVLQAELDPRRACG